MNEAQMESARKRVGRMSYEDLQKLPDDGLRHELIDGEHFVTASPLLKHQVVAGNLYLLIGNHVRATGAGILLFAPFDVVCTPNDVVVPDLIYFAGDRLREVVTDNFAQGPPNLAIEILSPSTRRRDEVLKRRLYERFRVAEYWIVDPALETVTIHRLDGDAYQPMTAKGAEAVTTPQFPNLSISLPAIFAMPVSP
jgi:Uma2 family endonuclease